MQKIARGQSNSHKQVYYSQEKPKTSICTPCYPTCAAYSPENMVDKKAVVIDAIEMSGRNAGSSEELRAQMGNKEVVEIQSLIGASGQRSTCCFV